MPILAWSARLSQEDSTYWILGTIVGILAILVVFFLLGWLEKLVGVVGRLLQSMVNAGFKFWERTLFWARWPSYLTLSLLLLGVGIDFSNHGAAWLGLLIALVLLTIGVTACLAFIFVSLERYEVARGYKVIHNPAKGQMLAHHVIRYAERLGPIMLGISAIVTIAAFALLNHALFKLVGQSWYIIRDPEAAPAYLDFVAFTLINLLRVVDFLDLLSSTKFVTMSFVRQGAWPVTLILTVFKSFFMLVLVQQVLAAIREQRMLGELVADFWNPHTPIHERALSALSQFGPQAVAPVLQSMEKADSLTMEQRVELPKVLADLGSLAVPQLMTYLQHKHPTIRGVAVMALGHLRVPATAQRLAFLVSDPNPAVRSCVAEALGSVGEVCGKNKDRRTEESNRRVVGRIKTWVIAGGRYSVATIGYAWRGCRRVLGNRRPPSLGSDPLIVCVEALRILLKDPEEEEVRAHAINALGQIGPNASLALGDLLACLPEESASVRALAAEALGLLQNAPEQVVPALTELTRDASPPVRTAAATALGRFREKAIEAHGALAALLEDKVDLVRDAATAAIADIGQLSGEATHRLEQKLTHPDNLQRAQTAEALGEMGKSAGPAAPALVESLSDENDLVRGKAAEALGRIGEGAAEVAIPALIDSLLDDDNTVQALAAEALGQMGTEAATAIPQLMTALDSNNAEVRSKVVRALGRLKAEDAREKLEAACRNGDADVRIDALAALAEIGAATSSTFQIFLQSTSDDNPRLREAAVSALSRCQERWPEIVPAVVALIDDQEPAVSRRAMETIPLYGEDAFPSALEALRQRLRDEGHSDLAAVAADTIGRFGEAGRPAAADLIQTAQTGDAEMRRQAIKALTRIQPAELQAVLAAALHDADASVRRQASAGLGMVAELSEEITPKMLEALHDPDPRVQANVVRVLAKLKNVPSEAEPTLLGFANSPVDDLRRATAAALGGIDSARSRAALQRLTNDSRTAVREQAVRSLADLDRPVVSPADTGAVNSIELPRNEVLAESPESRV